MSKEKDSTKNLSNYKGKIIDGQEGANYNIQSEEENYYNSTLNLTKQKTKLFIKKFG